jgi:cytochrome c-type biogenesis protein CcmH
MDRTKKIIVMSLFMFLFNFTTMQETYASVVDVPNRSKLPVYREDLLNVAKELHPPGCLDSMTADYCELATAFDLRRELTGMLAQGKKKDQIIDELVDKYGERILAAPSTEGFNLLAWILPGIGIVAGAAALSLFIRSWVRRTSAQVTESIIGETVSDEQKTQINEELKKWL